MWCEIEKKRERHNKWIVFECDVKNKRWNIRRVVKLHVKVNKTFFWVLNSNFFSSLDSLQLYESWPQVPQKWKYLQ